MEQRCIGKLPGSNEKDKSMNINRLKKLSGLNEGWDDYDNRQSDQDEYGSADVKKVPLDLWSDIIRALESARYCDHDEVSVVLNRIEQWKMSQ